MQCNANANAKAKATQKQDQEGSQVRHCAWCEGEVCVSTGKWMILSRVFSPAQFEKHVGSFRRQGNGFVADSMVVAIVWCMVDMMKAGNT